MATGDVTLRDTAIQKWEELLSDLDRLDAIVGWTSTIDRLVEQQSNIRQAIEMTRQARRGMN